MIGPTISLKSERAQQHSLDVGVDLLAKVVEEGLRIRAGGLAQGEGGIDPDFRFRVITQSYSRGEEDRVLK